MKQATLTQHAIGQGGFYTGILELQNGEKFSYVYDCGSVTSKRNKKGKSTRKTEFLCDEIDQFIQDVNGKIDVIFISHLDRDHINGLKYLLNKIDKTDKKNTTHKTKIILPYLNSEEVVYFFAQKPTNKSLIKEQLSFLFPFESIIPYKNVSIFYITHNRAFNKLENVIDIEYSDAKDFKYTGDCKKIKDKDVYFFKYDGSKFLLKDIWEFIPYCNYIDDIKKQNLTNFFKKKFGAVNYFNIKSVLIHNKNIKLLKKYFKDNISKDHNYISLCIYSTHSENLEASDKKGVLRAGFSWQYTGDINLIGNKDFLVFYRNLVRGNNIFCIPHHGSEHNFDKECCESIIEVVNPLSVSFTVSYGKRNQYKHPTSNAIDYLSNSSTNSKLYEITEERSSLEIVLKFSVSSNMLVLCNKTKQFRNIKYET